MEDSFIDDTDEALQAYLYSTYIRDDDVDGGEGNGDDRRIVVDDDDDESDTGESNDEIPLQRDSPYTLRNSHTAHTRSSRGTMNGIDRYVSKPSPIGDADFVSAQS